MVYIAKLEAFRMLNLHDVSFFFLWPPSCSAFQFFCLRCSLLHRSQPCMNNDVVSEERLKIA